MSCHLPANKNAAGEINGSIFYIGTLQQYNVISSDFVCPHAARTRTKLLGYLSVR
ncbi:hypothetical protein J7E37_18895 [Bacillus sp. ISL-39]|nr:hypothetical protein [Bacillus sp. ISL-39]